MRTGSATQTIGKLGWTAVMAVFVALWNFPIGLTLATSLKTDQEIFANPFALPTTLFISAFVKAWTILSYSQLFWNSVLYATGGSVLAILLALVPSYLFSSFRIRGQVTLFVVLLTTLMLPQETVIIPLFSLMRSLHLLDSKLGLILVHGVYGMPFEILVLTGFMATIPRDLLAAGRMDGCTDFGLLRHVVIPLTVPAMTVGFTLNFIEIWKEYFFALIFLSSDKNLPVNIGILSIANPQYFTSMNLPSAAVVLAQLPIVILFVLAYRTIMQGLYVGGVKG